MINSSRKDIIDGLIGHMDDKELIYFLIDKMMSMEKKIQSLTKMHEENQFQSEWEHENAISER